MAAACDCSFHATNPPCMPLTDRLPVTHSEGGVQLLLYSSVPIFNGSRLKAHKLTCVALSRDPTSLSPIKALEMLPGRPLFVPVPADIETFLSYPRKLGLFVTVPDA